MPILAPSISSAILAANPSLAGPSWVQTTTAIGMAVATWAVIPANVVLVGSVSGTVGSGVVAGKFFLNPSPAPVVVSMASATFLGLESAQVGLAVGLGVGTALNASAAYLGVSPSALGSDFSKVTFVNPASLIALLTANLAAQGIFGPLAGLFSVGLGNGIAAMVATGGGTGVATGAPGPSPATGATKSSLV